MENKSREAGNLPNWNERTKSLTYLPAYASFLLTHHLKGFALALLKVSREEDVPLLRYFSSYSDEELAALGENSNRDLLTLLSENNLQAYIDKSTANFIANQLPTVDREEVMVEDITLVSLVRRKVFRDFLPAYTKEQSLFINVMQELDRFIAATEAASFNAYNRIQQEKISRINEELELRQQELLEAQSLAGMGSFFWDMKDGNSTYTPGALEIFGLTRPTDLEAFYDDVHPLDRVKLKAAMDKAFTEDGIFECEYSYTKKNFEKRIWSRGKINFVEGSPISMKGTVMDITNEYQLLERLQNSEELHKQAQALTHIGNWSWYVRENKIVWSDEMYRIYGLDIQSEEITFERFMSLIHPDDRDKRIQEIEETLQTGVADDYLLRIVTPAGETRMLKGKGQVITDGEQKPIRINGTCQDVTKEYLLNMDLQEKEQNFKQLINNAPDAVIVIDADSIITLWNPKTEEIFGWNSEEVVGKSLSQIIIPLRYRAGHDEGIKRYLKTGETHILRKTLDLTAVNKAQDEFYISLTVSETTQGGKRAFIAFIRDISQQKTTQLELQRKTSLLEYKNLELQRTNEELESFNYAASHDLQEPLRKIQTYSNRIIESTEHVLPAHVVSDLNKIMTASARMQNLLEDLLSFSQNTSKMQETEIVDVNALIEEVTNSYITDVEEKAVQIHVDQLPKLRVVPFQFLQLFINLLSNAIKYQRPGIPPAISIRAKIVSSSNDFPFKGSFLSKNYLRISVTDNGIGFEPEYASKIFELFTRLHHKEKYTGTGIGLATCKKIIHNHDGFINAESALGEGSTFHVYLPEECIVPPAT